MSDIGFTDEEVAEILASVDALGDDLMNDRDVKAILAETERYEQKVRARSLKTPHREKDVSLLRSTRGRTKTKKSSLAPKMWADCLPGQVEAKMIKCGKQKCKCARGELHGPYFYHRTWSGTEHQRRYIRLEDLTKVLLACKVHRDLQAEMREARHAYGDFLREARDFLKSL